jgi:methylthioribose-1-phosphate isomerase
MPLSRTSCYNKQQNMKAVTWYKDTLKLLDQSRLPTAEVYLELTDYRDVVAAIKDMKVRGAPAIGVVAAYGIALAALNIEAPKKRQYISTLKKAIAEFKTTRPTAINLFKAAQRMEAVIAGCTDIPQIRKAMVTEAKIFHAAEIEATQKICTSGVELIEKDATILTHCNAGPIATAGWGTALGIILEAHRQGKNINVINTETRPLCQGARLTCSELKTAGVPYKLITDSMAGHFMKEGLIDGVIVGADRIAANGDTANKIGTYTLAVLAKENNIPFYVAAPSSTFDSDIATGADIPIEERAPKEVTEFFGYKIAPEGTPALNPAFDVTPRAYITAIITEKGVWRG